MTVTAQTLQKIWGGEERMTDEIGLQTFPKTDTYDADVTFCGRVFHSWEAATGKVRSTLVKKTGASDDKR